MPKKKERPTLAEHVAIGQAIKDVDKALQRVLNLASPYLTTKEIDKLMDMTSGALRKGNVLLSIQSRLEDEMFADYPWLTNEAIGVYYHDDEEMTAHKLRELGRQAGMTDRNYWGGMAAPNGKQYGEQDMK